MHDRQIFSPILDFSKLQIVGNKIQFVFLHSVQQLFYLRFSNQFLFP